MEQAKTVHGTNAPHRRRPTKQTYVESTLVVKADMSTVRETGRPCTHTSTTNHIVCPHKRHLLDASGASETGRESVPLMFLALLGASSSFDRPSIRNRPFFFFFGACTGSSASAARWIGTSLTARSLIHRIIFGEIKRMNTLEANTANHYDQRRETRHARQLSEDARRAR